MLLYIDLLWLRPLWPLGLDRLDLDSMAMFSTVTLRPLLLAGSRRRCDLLRGKRAATAALRRYTKVVLEPNLLTRREENLTEKNWDQLRLGKLHVR